MSLMNEQPGLPGGFRQPAARFRPRQRRDIGLPHYTPGQYSEAFAQQPQYSAGGAYDWNAADRDWAYRTGAELMDDYGRMARREHRDFRLAEQDANDLSRRTLDDPLGGVHPDQVHGLEKYDSQLEHLRPDASDFDAVSLSADEKRGLMGQPDAGREYYQPDQLRAIQNETAWDRRGAARGYGGELRDAANETAGALREATGEYAKRLGGAVDPSKLSLSRDFAERYRLTPEMQRAMVEKNARDVQLNYATRVNDMARRAEAAGVNPAVAAAAQRRLMQDSAAQSADAMLNARIAAESAAAGRERDLEGMRLGAEGNIAELGLRKADSIGNYTMQALDRGGQYRMDAARGAGEASLGVERDIAGERQGLERYLQEAGYNQARAADDTRTSRYAGVADRDIDAGKTWYGMRADAQKAISGFREGRQARVFDAQQNNAQQARSYQYSRPGTYSQRGLQMEQMRQSAYGDTGRLGQQATQTRMGDELQRWKTQEDINLQRWKTQEEAKLQRDLQQKSRGSFWKKLGGAVLGGAANVLTGGAAGFIPKP